MEVDVDPELCIACGDCIDICPEVFDWDEEGLSHAVTEVVPPALEDVCQEAVEACPTEAIQVH